MKGANYFAVHSMSKKCGSASATSPSNAGLILLLLLCARTIEARYTPGHNSAFCNKSPSSCLVSSRTQLSSSTHRKKIDAVFLPTTKVLRKNSNNGLVPLLFMAAPGKSDEISKQERAAEIRLKIAKLKREGKIKNFDGTEVSKEDSAMEEAEAFFNKPSPVLKFQKRMEEIRRKAVLSEEAEASDGQGIE